MLIAVHVGHNSPSISTWVCLSLSAYLCDRWPGLLTKVAHVGLAVCR